MMYVGVVWTYAELAFHLADSLTYRAFCRVSALTATPSKSALAATLRRVSARTLAALNDQLVTSNAARAVERAQTVRMDATVVPVAIHPPTDSSLSLDAVRVLDRLLQQAEVASGFTAYHRHVKRAKRRAMEIPHLAPQKTARRRAGYRELLQLTEATATYASCALAHLECLPPTSARDRVRTRRRLARYRVGTEGRIVHLKREYGVGAVDCGAPPARRSRKAGPPSPTPSTRSPKKQPPRAGDASSIRRI